MENTIKVYSLKSLLLHRVTQVPRLHDFIGSTVPQDLRTLFLHCHWILSLCMMKTQSLSSSASQASMYNEDIDLSRGFRAQSKITSPPCYPLYTRQKVMAPLNCKGSWEMQFSCMPRGVEKLVWLIHSTESARIGEGRELSWERNGDLALAISGGSLNKSTKWNFFFFLRKVYLETTQEN